MATFTFTITVKAKDPSSSIRSLRWVLKRLLRQHQLRAIDVREETKPTKKQR